jgi:hypothetical protein
LGAEFVIALLGSILFIRVTGGLLGEEALGEAVAGAIRVFVEGAEFLLDAQARGLAKVIDELKHVRVVAILRGLLEECLGAQTRGGNGE